MRFRRIAGLQEHLRIEPADNGTAAAGPDGIVRVESEFEMVCAETGIHKEILLCLRIKHRQRVAVKYTTPDTVLRIDVSSAAARAFHGKVIPIGFQSLAVGHPHLIVIHLHAGHVVLRVRDNVVCQSERAARRVGHVSPRVGSQVDMPRAARLTGSEGDIHP